MKIGSTIELPRGALLAPMAGVTDWPFRQLCENYGASLTYSEMMTANAKMWHTEKSFNRLRNGGDRFAVQIAGSDPEEMAQAARYCIEQGGCLVDINMGCPAKKVNKKMAGSALLQYPDLVERILTAVVAAVEVPVTLKIRTGWDTTNKNAVEIGRIAQGCGIQALTVHGRSRSCLFKGEAEHDTVREVKSALSIPVIANGDIDSPEKAARILQYTQVDAVMIGRGAQGRPWIFKQVKEYLQTGSYKEPSLEEKQAVIMQHLHLLHDFYGDVQGHCIARKHIGWYMKPMGNFDQSTFNALSDNNAQLTFIQDYFEQASQSLV